MLISFVFIFMLVLLLIPASAYAEIYRYVDENGVTCYTDIPASRAERVEPSGASTKIKDIDYQIIIKETAKRYDIDPSLIHAVITTESNYHERAISRKGAMGLMQLMPSTASLLGVSNPFHPSENIDGGTRYLKYLLESFGDLRLALAAYNAGPEYVKKYRSIPPIKETREYVKKVLTHYNNAGGSKPNTLVIKPSLKPKTIYRLILEDGTIFFTNTLEKNLLQGLNAGR